jgi:hypothetical protein
MKIKRLIAVAATLGFGLWVASASANVIFTLGNNPQPGEENIVFTNGDTGATITGVTDVSFIDVEFSSLTGQTLAVQGQSLKEENGDPLTSMYVVAPGYTFEDFILNLANGSGTATVTVVDNFNEVFQYALGNGQNFLTITTSGGETIASISVTMSAGGGFDTFQNPRISELVIAQVPEPQTLALLGFGLLSLLFARRLRRA